MKLKRMYKRNYQPSQEIETPQNADVLNKAPQEQALESTGKMVEDYVEAQKSVMNAVFNSPEYRTMKMLIECLVTGSLQESLRKYKPDSSAIFSKTFQHTTRIGNDILFGNIEDLGKRFWNETQRHTKEFTTIDAAIQQKPLETRQKKTAA